MSLNFYSNEFQTNDTYKSDFNQNKPRFRLRHTSHSAQYFLVAIHGNQRMSLLGHSGHFGIN